MESTWNIACNWRAAEIKWRLNLQFLAVVQERIILISIKSTDNHNQFESKINYSENYFQSIPPSGFCFILSHEYWTGWLPLASSLNRCCCKADLIVTVTPFCLTLCECFCLEKKLCLSVRKVFFLINNIKHSSIRLCFGFFKTFSLLALAPCRQFFVLVTSPCIDVRKPFQKLYIREFVPLVFST